MSDALDPEEGADDPYCEAMPGVEPHNYQPVVDLFGSGIWLFCTQCGDYYLMDGTAPTSGGLTGAAPGQMPLPTGTQPSGTIPPPRPTSFPFNP